MLEQRVQMHPRPEPGDEGIAMLCVFERDLGPPSHRLVTLHAGDDHLAHLVFTFGQVASQEDLLRAGRQVGQFFRIDPGGPQPLELDLQVADRRPGDFAQQFQRHGLGPVGPADLPQRPAAQRSDRLQHQRLEAAAYGHCVQRRGLALPETPQPLAERHRVGVIDGFRDDPVADVDHPGVAAALLRR